MGDGTEVLTDSDDTEMFDNSEEEDKDLISQVSKGPSRIEELGDDEEEGGNGKADSEEKGDASEKQQPPGSKPIAAGSEKTGEKKDGEV